MTRKTPSQTTQDDQSSALDRDLKLRRVHDAARRWAATHGREEQADDFAQEVALATWLGRDSCFKYQMRDFMEKYVGSNRSTSGRRSQTEHLGLVSVADVPHGYFIEPHVESTVAAAASLFKGDDLRLFNDFYVLGYRTQEIAEMQGLHPSEITISLRSIKNALAELKEKIT